MAADRREELDLPQMDQVGFVVRDLEAAIAQYEPMFGPFSTMDPGPMSYDYRGAEEECDMRLAFGRSGDVEIELIQWLRGGCPHKEFIDAGREGMHHLRFRIDDLQSKVAEAEAIGYRAIWSKRYGEGLAVAYLEREGDPLLLELFENHHG
ncbi:MAG: VOC family protein [Halioglobus sp.]|nr:VOC family protein [Halioglobus sp.]